MAVPETVAAEPTTGYELTVFDDDPVRTTIRAAGELDLAARDDLAHALRQQEDAGRRIVRLDLSKVTFLDCSCLGVLVVAQHRFVALRGLLVLTGVSDAISRIITITGLSDTLLIVPTDQDPFGSVLTAQLARRSRIRLQQSLLLTALGSSGAAADQLGRTSHPGPPHQPEGPDTPEPGSPPHESRPGKGLS